MHTALVEVVGLGFGLDGGVRLIHHLCSSWLLLLHIGHIERIFGERVLGERVFELSSWAWLLIVRLLRLVLLVILLRWLLLLLVILLRWLLLRVVLLRRLRIDRLWLLLILLILLRLLLLLL